METPIEIAALYIASYIVGAIPTAYIIGKLVRGVDLRGVGSGNIGGANVFEHVGKRWVVPLTVFDAFVKGAAPVWAGLFILDLDRSSVLLIGAPLLAIAGNNWSPFLRLQGGRGITITGGALLALSPVLMVAVGVVAIGGWLITKSSGLWVLISLALLPLWAYLVHGYLSLVWYCLALLGIIVLKRLSSNWSPFPQGISGRKVLFNRLLRDRDVADRNQWVTRAPGTTP